jgi:hypothetical protein
MIAPVLVCELADIVGMRRDLVFVPLDDGPRLLELQGFESVGLDSLHGRACNSSIHRVLRSRYVSISFSLQLPFA